MKTKNSQTNFKDEENIKPGDRKLKNSFHKNIIISKNFKKLSLSSKKKRLIKKKTQGYFKI